MNKQRVKELAHGWYHGPAMPTPAEAAEHFRLCAVRDPHHAVEYGEAMAAFLNDRAQRPSNSTYTPAAAHADASEFRERMKQYLRIGPPLAGFRDGDSE